jgi:hypothetical protein
VPSSPSFRAVRAAAVTLALLGCLDDQPALYYGLPDAPAQDDKDADAAEAPLRAAVLPDSRVILVTVDGVRWQDVFSGGAMPRTRKLVDQQGVGFGAGGTSCGVVQTATGTNISLPGYFEIFTGRATTCASNNCDRTSAPTLFDEAAAANKGQLASISSWPQIDRAVARGTGPFVAAGRSPWPDTGLLAAASVLASYVNVGRTATAMPGAGDYRPDRYTAAVALQYYKARQPVLFHMGLGDTDEWAHVGDYPGYIDALLRADAAIADLADAVALGDAANRTTVIVTTDHGRDEDFREHSPMRYDASRTFILAFGARVPVRGVVCPWRNLTLADIAPTIRVILGLPSVRGPRTGHPIAEIIR